MSIGPHPVRTSTKSTRIVDVNFILAVYRLKRDSPNAVVVAIRDVEHLTVDRESDGVPERCQ
ncbi:hypothetical protein D3C72_2075060 [compost metagenome]